MTFEYPMSAELRQAIEALFDEPVNGFIALGVGDNIPRSMREPAKDSNELYTERVAELCVKLEEWVKLYSAELGEFDSEYDTTRLRSEGRAILMALREIANFFPEAFTQNQ